MNMVLHLIELSGGLLVLMAGLLLIAITVIIERAWFFSKVIDAGKHIEHDLRRVGYGQKDAISKIADRYTSTVQARLIRTALASRSRTGEDLGQQIDEEIMGAMPKLDRLMWVIDTAVTLAPLLGLFGTIVGMIDTFNVLGHANAAVKATGGIADALVSTGMGLGIAIVSIIFLNYFNKRLRLALHQLEFIRVILVNRIFGGGTDHPAADSEPNEAPTTSLTESAATGNDQVLVRSY